MAPRSRVVRLRIAPVEYRDGLAIVGAVACVLAAATLYLCFLALALIDDG